MEVKSGLWKGHYMQYHQRHLFTMNLEFKNNKVTGGGDDNIGSFTVDGKYKSNGDIKFTKNYQGAHSVKYCGKITSNGLTINGKYKVGGYGEDSFTMSAVTTTYIDVKSGHWIGYYMQYRDRHVFSMSLKFETDTVVGSGDDEIGTFDVNGTFDRKSGKIDFYKVYHGAHIVTYSGEVSQDGCTMYGKYNVGGACDDFTMSVNTWW